ncbi:ABC transporter ATP-binding protein [Microbacterium barkeri]|uniref:ABC transporter ATP-binding protein n=1 Tax=Microbacterium barkeri TaxID=33917 RepID=A0A9W6H5F5_9MICO|nr:ATP-binding cassette domain-containing protein [Microbacterium barkeri]MDR6877237.1 energy-coupling factor transport system ATP-binding protein [Microbacterium barkeri]GLJ62658.1 ABC transporter ATP-binding protein [Microbacterium barkeri]
MTAAETRPCGILAEGWGWRYGTRLAWAAQDVTLSIRPGERVLLLGASGSGKSTVLQALAGVLGGEDEGEQAGRLLVDGAPPEAARGRTGLVQQDPDAQAVLARVGDDVAFGCENLGVPHDEIWSRVQEALAIVGLDVPLDRSTSALSGGQKQRLALAGALAMRPGLLLLDEPTANLDPEGVVEVRDAVSRVVAHTGATLVVVEHRVDVWLPVVDRVIVLGGGQQGVVADGTPEVVLARRGAELASGGVWVPGIPPRRPGPPRHAPGAPLLAAEALQVGRLRDTAVAGPVDLEVRPGEVLGITGRNGAGKSTLARTLAGLLPPVDGRVAAAPELAAGAGPAPIRWRSREILTRIGTVLQSPDHQLLANTVRAELEVGMRALRLPDAEISARGEELLAALRLAHLADANPHTLSGGEKRRLTVAAMLATRPRVCVLDEPTFGQDATTWAELVDIIARLRDGADAAPSAVVAVTHDADVLAALDARVHRLDGAGVLG